MERRSFLSWVALTLPFTLVRAASGAPAEPSGGNYILPQEELRKRTTSGLLGNPEDAWLVAMHMAGAEPGTDKPQQWNLIAAENGHPLAQISQASAMADEGADNRLRAKFWQDRAIASGDARVKEYIRQIGLPVP